MMSAASTFLLKLREEVNSVHKSIEQLPLSLSIMSKEVSIDDYRDYLMVLYGFVTRYELHICPKIGSVLADLDERKKSELLYCDLKSLGCDPDKIALIDIGIFKTNFTTSEALGSMYVLEGSTLGGQIISKHLENALGGSVAGSLKYLTPYDKKTGSMWRGFLAIFCEFTLVHGNEDEAIAGALSTFSSLKRWMAQTPRFTL